MRPLPVPFAANAGIRFASSSRPSAAHAATRCSRGGLSARPSNNALAAVGFTASLTPRARRVTTKDPCAQSSTRSSTKDGGSSPALCRRSYSQPVPSCWRAHTVSCPCPCIRGDARAEASTRQKISRGTWAFRCGALSGAYVPRHHRPPWTPGRDAETSAMPSVSLLCSRLDDADNGWKGRRGFSSMTCGRPVQRSRHAPRYSRRWVCAKYGR